MSRTADSADGSAGRKAAGLTDSDSAANPFEAVDWQILAMAGSSGELTANLHALCDHIGPRFAGTPGYRQAAEFARDRFLSYGLDSTHLEPFEFSAWRRDAPGRLALQRPVTRELDCYTLPYSAATGDTPVTAELFDIGDGSAASISAAGDQLAGRFAFSSAKGGHRTDIYARCEEAGAAGLIIVNHRPGAGPATGTVTYGQMGTIPAVCISYEAAMLLQRVDRGARPVLSLTTQAHCEPATTWNVVADLPASVPDAEMVIIGGHLDSHEIGPGAFDNAAGAVVVMEVARLLAPQRRLLRRSIRFINFGAEEVGLLGSHYHAQAHPADMARTRFMLNVDTPGLSRPTGLAFHRCPQIQPYLRRLEGQFRRAIPYRDRIHSHSDHFPFILQGIPTAGVCGGPHPAPGQQYTHMAADTPDKLCPADLSDIAAFVARIILRAANDPTWPDMRRGPDDLDALLTREGIAPR